MLENRPISTFILKGLIHKSNCVGNNFSRGKIMREIVCDHFRGMKVSKFSWNLKKTPFFGYFLSIFRRIYFFSTATTLDTVENHAKNRLRLFSRRVNASLTWKYL